LPNLLDINTLKLREFIFGSSFTKIISMLQLLAVQNTIQCFSSLFTFTSKTSVQFHYTIFGHNYVNRKKDGIFMIYLLLDNVKCNQNAIMNQTVILNVIVRNVLLTLII